MDKIEKLSHSTITSLWIKHANKNKEILRSDALMMSNVAAIRYKSLFAIGENIFKRMNDPTADIEAMLKE